MTDTPSLELFLDLGRYTGGDFPAEQQAERGYIVLNTLLIPILINFNGAWVTHGRFLDSQFSSPRLDHRRSEEPGPINGIRRRINDT
jgi:hypothetical protein